MTERTAVVYLPHKIWAMQHVNDGGGYYLIYEDEIGTWRGVRTFDDGRRSRLYRYADEPEMESFSHLMPRGVVELSAQNFRINWGNGDKIAVVQVGCRDGK